MSKELKEALRQYAETSHRAIDAAHAASLAADLTHFLMGEDDSANMTFRDALEAFNEAQARAMALGNEAEKAAQSLAQRARGNPPRSPDPEDV